MRPSEPIEYFRIAWLFASSDRHGEGVRYLEAQQNDAGYILATELFSDAGAWADALPRYARIDEVLSDSEYLGLKAFIAVRLAIALAFIHEFERAREVAERAVALAADCTVDVDPFVRIEARVATSIVRGGADRSVETMPLQVILNEVQAMESKDPWRAAKMYQDLAHFHRRAGKSESADELQLRSWSLRDAAIGAPDFNSMEAVAARFKETRGQNDVWEDRHFLRTSSILCDKDASRKVRAVALERYLALCARHRDEEIDTASTRKAIEWITEFGQSFVESEFQRDQRVFTALVYAAARRWRKALAIMRQRIVYENGQILNEVAGQPLEVFLKVMTALEATQNLLLAILASAPDHDPADVRDVFGALSMRRHLAEHAEALKYRHWRSHVGAGNRDAMDDWIRLRKDITTQAFHHLIGPRGSVQMLGFDRGWGRDMLPALPRREKREAMEALMFLMKASNNTKLFNQRAAIEQKLRETMPPIDLRESIANVDLHELREHLLPGEVFIEYLRASAPKCPLVAEPAAGETADLYYAFACSADMPLAFVPIGSAAAVDAAVLRFRHALGVEVAREAPIKWIRPDRSGNAGLHDEKQDSGDASKDLFKVLLAPILRLVPRAESFTIVADGAICQVPFQALREDDGSLIVDRYLVRYVSSARDLVVPQDSGTPCSSPTVVAAPDFDLYASDVTGNAEAPPENRAIAGSGSVLFRPLPGSALEGAEVASLLGATLLTGSDATVEAVSSLVSPEVLHIASHGFFFPLQAAESSSPDGEEGADDPLSRLATGFEDPLLRTGIALAGANSWLYGRALPAQAHTGFLTAQAISTMDLTGTSLVTLSACDTGLGDASIGQGIIGLRQSLAVAGARWIIVALWPVPDRATASLMRRFYAAWDRKSPPHAALREAQLAMRQDFDGIRSWCGFICIGPPPVETRPAVPFGKEALRQLALVPLQELLDEAHMTLSPPEGFEARAPEPSSARLDCHALVTKHARVEIRYSIVPFRGPHRARFTETDYQNLLHSVSDGQGISPSPFPEEGVRVEFGAHAGFTATVSGSPHLDGYAFAAIAYIAHEAFGAALIWYLFDRMEDVLPLMYGEFNSLRFRESSHDPG